MSKKTLLLTLFLFITAAFSPVAAQGNSGADTVYTFRFLPQKDMFYVPMYDNENELARLLDCIDRLMPGITAMSTDTVAPWAAKKKTSPQLPYVQTV